MKIIWSRFLLGMFLAGTPMMFLVYAKTSSPKTVNIEAVKPSVIIHKPKVNLGSKKNTQHKFIASSQLPNKLTVPVKSPTPTATPTPPVYLTRVELNEYKKPSVTLNKPPDEIGNLINKYSKEFNVDTQVMKHIAYCESHYRADAENGPFAGIYQFISSTWRSNRKAMGLDINPDLRFNAEEAIKTAAFKMSRDGFGAWPVCGKKALQAKLSAK